MNMTYANLSNAELVRYGLLRNFKRQKLANFSNILRRKFAVWVADFQHAINSVVCLRTEKQMCRTNARRIIAAMQNVGIFKDVTMRKNPRKSMCEISSVFWTGRKESSISVELLAAFPYPTCIKFFLNDWTGSIDFAPKQIWNRLRIFSRHVGSIPCYMEF